ncbi:50S ribosomal protein L25 [Effusibacillus pohliae]|uniref:50S ribosomal protein L25 n=1 Tax=Effusibacillus pohliae TaxID=232270 RepID=UPI00036E2DC6|nr:50S ribosomal protein L25 [Effusibacillus pohliae]
MQGLVLDAEIRKTLTRGELNRIRRKRGVPAIVYGQNVSSTPIYVKEDAVRQIVEGKHHLVELNIPEMGRYPALVQEIQRESVNRKVIHIDFHVISLDEPVDADVPVIVTGASDVEKRGGVVQLSLREVTIRTLPTELPETVEVDISHMEIGDTLFAGDLQLPANCQLKSDPDQVIVTIIPPQDEQVEADTGTTESAEAVASGQ